MLTLEERSMIPVLNQNQARVVTATFGKAWTNAEVFDEIDSGFGIADVVIFNREALIHRDGSRDVFFEREDQIRTLFVLNDHDSFSVTDLSQRLPFSRTKLRNYLAHFERAGFVRALESDLYEVTHRYVAQLNDSIAIEAKIKDWKRGLYQAYRYRWFSNASYLAVHHKYANAPLRNLAEFQRLNVGLLVVEDSSVSVLFQPEVSAPKSSILNALAYERVLERLS